MNISVRTNVTLLISALRKATIASADRAAAEKANSLNRGGGQSNADQ